MSTEYYFLSVNATGLNAAIKINDLPVIILNEGTELMTEKMVASWLMNGENCLSAALIALPEQEQIQGKIKATLFLHDNTKEEPTPQKILAEIVYPIPSLDNKPAKKASISQTFNFHRATTRVWQEAENIANLSEKDKSEIKLLINELQYALTHDTKKAITLQNYKITEDALAEGKSPDQVIKATEVTYNWLAEQQNVTPIKIEEKDLRYTIGGNNNVVFVSQSNLNHALQLENDDLFFEIPIYAAKINSTWTLAR